MGVLALPFLLGVLVLLVAIFLSRKALTADPRRIARVLRLLGGAGGVLGGLGLMAAKQPFLGVALLGTGGGLLARELTRPPLPKGAPRTSEVQTFLLRMVLQHDTGDIDGDILGGPYRGRLLSSLRRDEFEAFYDACRNEDPDALPLLDSYAERRFQGEAEAPPSGASSSAMTAEEAREILGVDASADAAAIKAAHRRLIAKMHPDQGGSDWLAERVNRARDLLLGKSKG